MSWAKSASGAFAMYEDPASFAFNEMFLPFAGVIRNIVKQVKPCAWQATSEDLSHQMGEYLSIGQRTVHGCAHRAEIVRAE